MTMWGLRAAGAVALAVLGLGGTVAAEGDAFCVECLRVRVGPPMVIRGPYPDELDAVFTALKLPDGSFRSFSANGSTYAIDGPSLTQMNGPRRPVLEAGPPGSRNDCGSWLTSTQRLGGRVLGMVHQEHDCDYDKGKTDKSMSVAESFDDGLTWTNLGTVITGTDSPLPDAITGEGDCTMVNPLDGYLYAYCLRNSDWQTIVARAPIEQPTDWLKYYQGAWNEPGLGGKSTDIGFVGIGTGYIKDPGLVAAVATDPWFGGVRLSLSQDKVSFADLGEPLLPIDGSDWHRPAPTDLIAYTTVVNPQDGSNSVDREFLLAYVYVPAGKGFEDRHLVFHDVTLTMEDASVAVQVGAALTRWSDGKHYVTSTGPLTGDWRAFQRETVVAYMLPREPVGAASIKFADCSLAGGGQRIAVDGTCEADGGTRIRTAGWLFAAEQQDTVPVYLCRNEAGADFASAKADCEGLGAMQSLLGYGLRP